MFRGSPSRRSARLVDRREHDVLDVVGVPALHQGRETIGVTDRTVTLDSEVINAWNTSQQRISTIDGTRLSLLRIVISACIAHHDFPNRAS